jgi:sugar/nucleoside kinase (ribokinase family)
MPCGYTDALNLPGIDSPRPRYLSAAGPAGVLLSHGTWKGGDRMALVLVIGTVALDRPIWLYRPLCSGGRSWGRSQAGDLHGRLGGGAANAGCALRAAGHRVLVASMLAEDTDGAEARRLAEAAGLDLTLTGVRPGRSSKTLILIEPDGERTILGLDGGLDRELDRAAMQRIRPSIPGPSALTDARPDGLFVRSAYEGAVDWARTVSGPVLLHWPSGTYTGEADVVVASADDLPAETAREPYTTVAATLTPRLQWVVVTHGAAGAVAHGPDGTIAVPATARTVCDATGAGDVFAAGLLDALMAGASMRQALEHACAWGGASVELEGSAHGDAPPDAFKTFEEILQT